jgi:hypothetical protein
MRVVILASVAMFMLASAADAQNEGALAPAAGTTQNYRPLDLTLRPDGAARAVPQASAIEAPIQAKTAIDHQFAPEGLVGQAGYLCGIGGLGPDSDALHGGPASAHGHSGTFLGASLGYAFR